MLVNNGGGGIFDFLPVSGASMARRADIYTRHVATPTGLNFAIAAELYGLMHERVEDLAALRAGLERALSHEHSSILEIPGDRGANVELHRDVWAAVSRAVSSQAAGAEPPA